MIRRLGILIVASYVLSPGSVWVLMTQRSNIHVRQNTAKSTKSARYIKDMLKMKWVALVATQNLWEV